jgi:uncharacterized membrane protein YfcA
MIHVAVFGVAIVISIFGLGGGVFYVPVLIGFGLSFHQATNASLLIILVTGLSSLIVFHRQGLVDWRLALLLDPAKDVGAFLGGLYSYWFGENMLSLLFAAILVVGGVFMVRYREENDVSEGLRPQGWKGLFRGRGLHVNVFLTLLFCLAAGFISGLLGIGGGIFMVPLMILTARVPIKIAVATSSLMVCLTGAFGFAGGLMAGHFEPSTGMLLAIAAFLGAQVGPRVGAMIDRDRLRKAFVGLMFVVALLMVYRGLT